MWQHTLLNFVVGYSSYLVFCTMVLGTYYRRSAKKYSVSKYLCSDRPFLFCIRNAVCDKHCSVIPLSQRAQY